MFSCFDVVPLDTSPWKPLIAPQAIVMNRKGTIIGAASPMSPLNAGAVTSGRSQITPRISTARPMNSWWLLM